MNISRDEARRIADLAHLEFDEPGLDRMAAEMTKILTYIDQLREVQADGFEEHDASVTPFREDELRPSIDREAVARNAPQWRDGFFVVPKVIGGD
jgi:aspartyl-tRNA(Asn)/glutamyl-tRNA(Gln) amidotransferase subunit C